MKYLKNKIPFCVLMDGVHARLIINDVNFCHTPRFNLDRDPVHRHDICYTVPPKLLGRINKALGAHRFSQRALAKSNLTLNIQTYF